MSADVDLLRDGLVKVGREESSSENASLTEWRREALQKDGAVPAPATTRRASGTCRLCKERPALFLCVNCERDVCREDYWTMLGLCRTCATEEELARAQSGEGRTRPELGIKWVEE